MCVRTVGTEDIFPVLSLIGTLGSHNNICFTFCTQKHKKCKLQEKCVCCTSGGVLGGGEEKKLEHGKLHSSLWPDRFKLAGWHACTNARTHTHAPRSLRHHGHSVTTDNPTQPWLPLQMLVQFPEEQSDSHGCPGCCSCLTLSLFSHGSSAAAQTPPASSFPICTTLKEAALPPSSSLGQGRPAAPEPSFTSGTKKGAHSRAV